MKVLFIGGTGIISSASSKLALQKGIDLYLLNRGKSFRPAPAGAILLEGDIRNTESALMALADHSFDVVVDWVAYTPQHIETDIALFSSRTRQYIFISSASAYLKPPRLLPIIESTPLDNPYWDYSRNKIACEERLTRAYRDDKFPMTIVRPTHTYDATLLPFQGGYTNVARMRQGKPVVVHGDGTSLWTMTHHADFAVGLVGLLGNLQAIGESFHITSDEWLSWNQIYTLVAEAVGVRPQLVHVPSELIAMYDPSWGPGLLGDKSHCLIFDNSKIRRVVPEFQPRIPFSQGIREVIAWYDAHPEFQKVDAAFDAMQDKIIAAMQSIYPSR